MTLAAVLLAGGESRRMGCDKATLQIAGQPLWRRQLRILHALSPSAVFVSARLPPAWIPPGIPYIPDPLPSAGPLGGIAATLAAISATHLLVLPIDMPAMTAEHLAHLWSAAASAQAVVPLLNGDIEPLPAIFPAESAPMAASLLTSPNVSLRAFARALQAAHMINLQTIGPADVSLYANCNSPEEWARHAAAYSVSSNHD